jgi:myo-inositol-1(or 4)-monophosphatase
MPESIDLLVKTALDAADAAAHVHRARAGDLDALGGREKGHRDFVSEVDLEAQRAALGIIRDRHPLHRIMAEEEDGENGGPDGTTASSPGLPTWIVDPLDGTTNFLHGHPFHCASVGVVMEGEPVAGAVVAAATGERWWAGRGAGAFHSRGHAPARPIRVSGTRELRLALVGTGFPFKTPEVIPDYLPGLGRVLARTSGVRRCGSAALDLCYLAQGSVDCFWEFHLSPWDVAGGLAILAEAGGTWQRIEGGAVAVDEGGSLLAANGPELLEALGVLVGAPTRS